LLPPRSRAVKTQLAPCAPAFRYGSEDYSWRETWFSYGACVTAFVLPLTFFFRCRTPQMPVGKTLSVERHAIESRLSPLVHVTA